MRTNGTLQYSISSGGGFDEGGAPIPESETWSEEIPCSIKTVTNNSRGRYEDGRFDQTTFDVLVEYGTIPLSVTFVKLARNGVFLGDFRLQGKPIPTTMCRIKFSV